MHSAFEPAAEAVITASPFETPVTTPLRETVATFSSLDVHCTPPAGASARRIFILSPLSIINAALSRQIPPPAAPLHTPAPKTNEKSVSDHKKTFS